MVLFGVISYAFVGVLYATLALLLLTSWRGHRIGGHLIAACVASAVWGLLVPAQSAGATVSDSVSAIIEFLRNGLWIAFIVSILVKLGIRRRIRVLAQAVWITAIITAASWSVITGQLGIQVDISRLVVPAGLAIALTGLVLVEQLYRNSPTESRRDIKLLALGVGGIFTYDLFVYSQGVFLDSLDSATWAARGAVNILFIPLIAISAKKNPDWELNIFVSRKVVFYSTTLVAVGFYLLLMSLGAYALLVFGGSWGAFAQTVFLAGALLVLITLLFSQSVRARVRVFLSKHFFSNRYDYRDEWLRLISTIAAFEDSSTRQIMVKALSQIVDSPSGSLWAIDERGSEFRVAASYREPDTMPNISAQSPLVEFIRRDGWLIDLAEYERAPAMYKGLELPEWMSDHESLWLIVPLMFRQQLIGLVTLAKAPGPPILNYEDRDLLKTVGSHLAVHLAQERADSLLAEAQQFEAYNRLTAFLMHDLNNLIAQQSLIIRNAEKHKRNPEFVDDTMRTIANSVSRMTRVMDQLKHGEAASSRKLTGLNSVLKSAVERCSTSEPVPDLTVPDKEISIEVDADQFSMVMTHLIQNAQEATQNDGFVSVTANRIDDIIEIAISDNGCGMSPEFVRDKLFRPFDSTKGSQGMGIGAYQAREFARRLGGDIHVESGLGDGTKVMMTLPAGTLDRII